MYQNNPMAGQRAQFNRGISLDEPLNMEDDELGLMDDFEDLCMGDATALNDIFEQEMEDCTMLLDDACDEAYNGLGEMMAAGVSDHPFPRSKYDDDMTFDDSRLGVSSPTLFDNMDTMAQDFITDNYLQLASKALSLESSAAASAYDPSEPSNHYSMHHYQAAPGEGAPWGSVPVKNAHFAANYPQHVVKPQASPMAVSSPLPVAAASSADAYVGHFNQCVPSAAVGYGNEHMSTTFDTFPSKVKVEPVIAKGVVSRSPNAASKRSKAAASKVKVEAKPATVGATAAPSSSSGQAKSQTKERDVKRGKYRCGRCGEPKDGHVCSVPDIRSMDTQCDLNLTVGGVASHTYKVMAVSTRVWGAENNNAAGITA